MSSTVVVRSPQTGDEARTLPPWNVVLWNSWQPMSYVVWVLKESVPGMTWKKATGLILQAHREGRSVVKQCQRELAEHHAERISSRGLKATAEPAG
jgi:ATP-dependent Clp protease adaptor protein ClpS